MRKGFRKDALDLLRKIGVPVLRWPGGCFAETYNWRDGIGNNRPVRHNWWTRNDGRYESNEVGTHEFFDLCELLGAKAYLAMNVTSITPLDAREWLDYCLSPKGSTTLAKLREQNGHPEPFKIDYIGVGNENWGGGGKNLITTPTYHVFDMYKNHMGANAVKVLLENNDTLSASASIKDGYLTFTLANLTADKDEETKVELLGCDTDFALAEAYVLSSPDMRDHNTFDEPTKIAPKSIKPDIRKAISVPAASVISMKIKLGS